MVWKAIVCVVELYLRLPYNISLDVKNWIYIRYIYIRYPPTHLLLLCWTYTVAPPHDILYISHSSKLNSGLGRLLVNVTTIAPGFNLPQQDAKRLEDNTPRERERDHYQHRIISNSFMHYYSIQ